MCIFTYTHLDCGHRKQDHIDTSSCSFFEHSGVHCQPDSRQHRERGTHVLTKRRSGECADCTQKLQDGWDAKELAAAIKESLEAAEKDRDARRKQQKRREDLERADQAEKARLTRDQARLAQEDADREAEREKKRKEERRLRKEGEKERRRQEEIRLAEDEARRLKKADRKRREQEAADLRVERDRLDQAEHERKLQKKRDAEARQREREEAEHQNRIKAQKDSLARKARRAREEAETEREQLAETQREATLRKQLQQLRDEEAKLQEKADEDERRSAEAELAAKKAANDEMERALMEAKQKTCTASSFASPSLPQSPSSDARSPKTPAVLDPAKLMGHHGIQEYGHLRIGNRPVPLHPSQKQPQTPLSSTTGSNIKSPLTPMGRLAGTVTTSPNDYTIQQPSMHVSKRDSSVPDWKKNLPSRTSSKSIPADKDNSTDELAARLQRRRAWEVEEESNQGAATGKEQPDWATGDTTPTTSSGMPMHSSSSPPPTYPPVPPLAHPHLLSLSDPQSSPSSPSSVTSKPKPPVPIKRISTIPTTTPPPSSTNIPTPPPMPPFKARVRVDSAAPSPHMGREHGADKWGGHGNEGARNEFCAGDVFGERRRRGWKVE